MFNLGNVRAAPLLFGTSSTNTSVTSAIGTDTSNPVMMPRANYSVQLTVMTTGTSGAGGTVVFQGSNDNAAWIALGSATATATQAGTSTTLAAAGATFTGVNYAYARGIVGVTGTGAASIYLGS